ELQALQLQPLYPPLDRTDVPEPGVTVVGSTKRVYEKQRGTGEASDVTPRVCRLNWKKVSLQVLSISAYRSTDPPAVTGRVITVSMPLSSLRLMRSSSMGVIPQDRWSPWMTN